jgi:hypothetical protein
MDADGLLTGGRQLKSTKIHRVSGLEDVEGDL